jgi:hypothetical protein
MDKAMAYLKENNIESFESSGILVIPCSNPDEIYDMATRVRKYFKEISFEKSWQIDPYYISRHSDLTAAMYGTSSQ